MQYSLEWSNAFDLLWNNISSNQAPGLNLYEKSIYLTKAQNELVKNYFEPHSRGNNIGKGFDDSAIRQSDFITLMRTQHFPVIADMLPSIAPRALVFAVPSNAIAVINEQIGLSEAESPGINDITETRQVIPIGFAEYTRLMSRPYHEPLKRQAWRLYDADNSSNRLAEIILNTSDRNYYAGKLYIVRYVKKPQPIVLANLAEEFGDGLTVEGASAETPCELPESMHEEILQRAVELAKTAWETDTNQQQMHAVSGQRSE